MLEALTRLNCLLTIINLQLSSLGDFKRKNSTQASDLE